MKLNLSITPANQTVAACISQLSVPVGFGLILVGAAQPLWLLTSIVMYMAMQLSVTVGCHRLFTHKTFECHRFWHWIFAFLTVLTWQASTVSWVHVHSIHHAHADTDKDSHITNWSFLFIKKYRTLTNKHSRVVALLAKDPMHLFFHNYALLVILATSLVFFAINPLLLLYGLILPMGYYFITTGLHQILSHRDGTPRNLPWFELVFPMGEWIHADHHKAPSSWDFGRYDLGTYLIKWIRK
jgi:stearoyl-CoA desaturase (delta-9 desaturase)